jgi:hypothetical protein
MSDEKRYYWVVICKNRWSHGRQNPLYGHTIALAETDFYSTPPKLPDRFKVRCDECAKEYAYGPADLMRFEMYPLERLDSHPLFR